MSVLQNIDTFISLGSLMLLSTLLGLAFLRSRHEPLPHRVVAAGRGLLLGLQLMATGYRLLDADNRVAEAIQSKPDDDHLVFHSCQACYPEFSLPSAFGPSRHGRCWRVVCAMSWMERLRGNWVSNPLGGPYSIRCSIAMSSGLS